MQQQGNSPIPQELAHQVKQDIENCLQFRKISFVRFLITKVELKHLKHRKIVQQIFSKYIPEKEQLVLDCSYLKNLNSYHYAMNMQSLGDSFLKLPTNFQYLQISLSYNDIGQYEERFNNLGFILSQLPCNMQILKLQLNSNKLELYPQNIWYLGQCMAQLPVNLKDLRIYLYWNNLGENPEGMKDFGDFMKQLPCKLENLELYISKNELGQDAQNIKYIGESLKFIPNQLQSLTWDLSSNDLGEIATQSLQYLLEGLQQIPNNNLQLQYLEFNLSRNKIEENQFQKFKDDCQGALTKIKKLEIDIYQ